MKRRTAIKNVSLGLGTLLSLPSWATNWNLNNLPSNSIFDEETKSIISSVCQAIIPKTDSPGALEIGIPAFAEAVIEDCYPKNRIETIKTGLSSIGKLSEVQFQKPISKLSNEQLNSLLNGVSSMPDLPEHLAFSELKSLCVQAYTNSEFYLTEVTDWEFAPARYLGCVPLNP